VKERPNLWLAAAAVEVMSNATVANALADNVSGDLQRELGGREAFSH
jgi:hypothetical protein